MSITHSAATDVGQVRQINEDSFLIDDSLGLYVVCDGMGGHAAGDVASQTAIEVVRSTVSAAVANDAALQITELGEVLRGSVEEANRKIHQMGRESRERKGMGTTCTALVTRGALAALAHVGDSRLYLCREGTLHQLSNDHTFVAEAIRQGVAKKGDPALAQHSNLVTRAVGPMPEVLVDTLVFDLFPGDTMMMCSDGLYEYFEDETELHERLIAPPDSDEAVLAQIATGLVSSANQRGGHDNITVVMLQVGTTMEEGPDMEAATPIGNTYSTLSHIDFFSELSLTELAQVTQRLTHVAVKAGQPVFDQGDETEGLFVLQAGEVVVERDGETVAELSPGAHFGEMALLNKRPRSATVRARQDSTLLHLSREAFYGLVQSDQVIGVKFLWKLAQTLSLRLEESFETPEEMTRKRTTLTFGLFPSPFDR